MATTPGHDGALENPGVSHERSDVPLWAVLVFFTLVFVLAVIVHAGIWQLMMSLQRPGPPERGTARPFVATPGMPPPGPQFERLLPAAQPVQQVDPAADLRQFRAHEREILLQRGWTDTPAGPAMPTARALDALRAAGLLGADDAGAGGGGRR